MMGPFLGPKKLTTLTNNINNNKLNKKFHSCRGHQIPFKPNLPSSRKRWVWQHTCPISTHFYCNRLKSQHCQKALMTKQPWPGDVTIIQNPDSEIWRDSILHSAMHSLMNSQARDTRDTSLNDDNVLEISEPRIRSTFERLYQNMNEAFGLGDY